MCSVVQQCLIPAHRPSRLVRVRACGTSVGTAEDQEHMRACLLLARQALGRTSPNPMVGCVIVKDGQVVGRGFHPKAGEPHAEVFALRDAGARSVGATAYVSLEPCNHFGRTPPCSQALVRARVKRVVVGSTDPNPLVAGQGINTLKRAGIEVLVGVEAEACRVLNEAFFHRIVTKKPFVCLRYCMSMDGGFLDGAEKRSAPEQGSSFSQQLQQYDVVIVDQATVSSNPVLLSSEPDAKQPLRVVVCQSLDLDVNADVFDTSAAPTLVVVDAGALVKDVQSTGQRSGKSMETMLRERNVGVVAVNDLELEAVLDMCYQRGACSVLLDSRDGANWLGKTAMQEELVQKLSVVVEPVILGQSRAQTAAFEIGPEFMKMKRLSSTKCGEAVIIEGYFEQHTN